MKNYHKINGIYKRYESGEKRGQFIMGDFAEPEFGYLFHNQWRGTEKIDGCLHYDNEILTDQGMISIGKIVNQKLPVKVLSYNENAKIIEYKDIEHYHKEKRIRTFLDVEVKTKNKGNRNKHIVCTDNHKFYSNGQWIESKNLIPGQYVSHLSTMLSNETIQIILGTLLGDGCIYRPSETTRGFSFSHSITQSEYFEYKKTLLRRIFNEIKPTKGGFTNSKENRRGNSIVNSAISDIIINNCEINGMKQVTKQWAKQIQPLGLAIWYMDDGTLGDSPGQRPRVRFSTNGFSFNEVKILKEMLESKFNIKSTINDYKGFVLCLDADSSETLFNLIFPFVPKVMQYKLPEKYSKYNCIMDGVELETFMGLIDTEVVSIKVVNKKKSEYQYDLTVADNSNYFTKNILVHNTNIKIGWDGKTAEIGGRTETSQIPATLVKVLNDYIAKWDLAKVLEKAYREDGTIDVTLYGEGYGAKIQKGGENYIPDGVDFILFDVAVEDVDGVRWYLDRKVVDAIAKDLGIKSVTVLFEGTLEEGIEFVKKGFPSVVGTQEAEGLVVVPVVEMQNRKGERIITKLKTKDFR